MESVYVVHLVLVVEEIKGNPGWSVFKTDQRR